MKCSKECCKYIPKRKILKDKREILGFLKKLQSDFKDKYGKGFSFSLVGSSKRNMVIQQQNPSWDFDFQIHIMSKDDIFEKETTRNGIREFIEKTIDNYTDNNNRWSKGEQKTSSIFWKKLDNKNQVVKKFDLVILKWDYTIESFKILQKKAKIPKEKNIKYIWNEVKTTYKKILNIDFKNLQNKKKFIILRQKYIEKKCLNQYKNKEEKNKY